MHRTRHRPYVELHIRPSGLLLPSASAGGRLCGRSFVPVAGSARCPIADFEFGAANKLSLLRAREACSRSLSPLHNALLESQGGWDVHSCKCSSYLDKRLPRLSVLRQGLPEAQQQALLAFATEGDYTKPTCPSCGIKMRHVAGTNGRHDLWGCANYPRCRQKLGIRAADRQ